MREKSLKSALIFLLWFIRSSTDLKFTFSPSIVHILIRIHRATHTDASAHRNTHRIGISREYRAHSRAFNVQRSFIVFDSIHGTKRSLTHIHMNAIYVLVFLDEISATLEYTMDAHIQMRTPWCFFIDARACVYVWMLCACLRVSVFFVHWQWFCQMSSMCEQRPLLYAVPASVSASAPWTLQNIQRRIMTSPKIFCVG